MIEKWQSLFKGTSWATPKWIKMDTKMTYVYAPSDCFEGIGASNFARDFQIFLRDETTIIDGKRSRLILEK